MDILKRLTVGCENNQRSRIAQPILQYHYAERVGLNNFPIILIETEKVKIR